MTSLREHIGTLLKNLPPIHNLEYKVVFNLHENTFFQKLVSEEVLKAARVKPLDYFKALMFLNYFTNVINNADYSVCSNLESLSKALRDRERDAGIDKGDEGASYLTIETVVLEAGVWAKEKKLNSGKDAYTAKELDAIKKRYRAEKPVDFARKTEPFYEGLGEMVLNQFSSRTQPFLQYVSSRTELEALAFTDSVLSISDDKQCSAEIGKHLSNKDYLSASLTALKALLKESSLDKIKLSLEKNA